METYPILGKLQVEENRLGRRQPSGHLLTVEMAEGRLRLFWYGWCLSGRLPAPPTHFATFVYNTHSEMPKRQCGTCQWIERSDPENKLGPVPVLSADQYRIFD